MVDMVGTAVTLDESLCVQPCTSSEPMRGQAASQMTCDAAVSGEQLDIGIWPVVTYTSQESGEPGGLNWRSIVPGPQHWMDVVTVWKGVKQAGRMSPMGITGSKIPVFQRTPDCMAVTWGAVREKIQCPG